MLNNNLDYDFGLTSSEIVIDKDLNNLIAIILCGGLGTRLRSLFSDIPKVLVPIDNGNNGDKVVFIDIVIDNLLKYGIRNFILCTGYKKEQIREHFENKIHYGYTIKFSEENEPLGTGGAIKKPMLQLSRSKDTNCILLNGDSICDVDFGKLYNFHIEKNALMTMVVSKYKTERYDSGNVVLYKETKLINKFAEKSNVSTISKIKNYLHKDITGINAGIYILNISEILNKICPFVTKLSFEYDLIPKLLKTNMCYGFETNSEIIDIGTPERYKSAINYFRTRTKS